MKMKKANFVIEPTGSVDVYRLVINNGEYTMCFDDWLDFLDGLLRRTKAADFDLGRLFTGLEGFLMFHENGFVVETREPHQLLAYTESVYKETWIRHLEKFRPRWGKMSVSRGEGESWEKLPKEVV